MCAQCFFSLSRLNFSSNFAQYQRRMNNLLNPLRMEAHIAREKKTKGKVHFGVIVSGKKACKCSHNFQVTVRHAASTANVSLYESFSLTNENQFNRPIDK